MLVASAGRGCVCGLSLALPAEAAAPAAAAPPPALAEVLAGGDLDGGDDVHAEGPLRCFAATQSAAWRVAHASRA